MKKVFPLVVLILLCPLILQAQEGAITFDSSDGDAVRTFDWAKQQALAYSYKNDPVGDWYEAAIAGREAFCLRDMIHQSMGAHFLGLEKSTKNMLRKFAEGISKGKDWCTFWEINRYGAPAAVDYTNDQNFWCALPANFDFIDASYRMFLWTGDEDYLKDPAFVNFYRRTLHEFVQRWDLAPERIMQRERVPKSAAARSRFRLFRGMPGYDETEAGFHVNLEQLAVQRAGYLAYAKIELFRGDAEESAKAAAAAKQMESLINTQWWDAERKNYYFYLDRNRKLSSEHIFPARPVLFWPAVEPARLSVVLDGIEQEVAGKPDFGNIYQSQLSMALYRHERSKTAYELLNKFTRGWGNTYPEMSFTAIEVIVSGMMGLDLEGRTPDDAHNNGGYVERMIVTTPRLNETSEWHANHWGELKNVPIRTNRIGVRHDGFGHTTLTNLSGPAIVWKARFPGSFQKLFTQSNRMGGYSKNTVVEAPIYPGGPTFTWGQFEVAPGESLIVKTTR